MASGQTIPELHCAREEKMPKNQSPSRQEQQRLRAVDMLRAPYIVVYCEHRRRVQVIKKRLMNGDDLKNHSWGWPQQIAHPRAP